MQNKVLVLAISAVLVVAFFLPWIDYFTSQSAWDLILGNTSKYIESSFKYTLLLVPISGVLIFYGSLLSEGSYVIRQKILFRLPILTLIVITIVIAANISENASESVDFEKFIKIFGVGFWLTVIASALLAFLPIASGAATPTTNTINTVSYSSQSKIGIGFVLLGLVLIFISTQKQFFTKKVRVKDDFFGGLESYGVLPEFQTLSRVNKDAKNTCLYAGLGALILGGIIFAGGRSSGKVTGEVGGTAVASTAAVPKFDWNGATMDIKKFLWKYKVITLIATGVVAGSFVVYNLFIKDDPVKDAKRLAKEYCGCTDELNKNKLTAMQSFVEGFAGKKYRSRLDARNDLNNLLQVSQAMYNDCTNKAETKFNVRHAEYGAKDVEARIKLENAYNSSALGCNGAMNSESLAMQSKVNDNIKGIIDPEPGIDRIKGDLIGREIPGWRFTYLNQFKFADILNISKAEDRIEYQVKFILNEANIGDHECEVIIVYLLNESGWYMSGANMIYARYTNLFFPDSYRMIRILPGCNWSAENNYKMAWKTSESAFAGEIVTGPNLEPATLPASEIFYIRSLEDSTILVRFTYRPR